MALDIEEPIPFESWEQISELKKTHNREQRISFNCEVCGKEYSRTLRFITSLLCKKCLGDKTAILRYGSVEEMQRLNLEHGKETCVKKYGSMERMRQISREKGEKTLQERYGVSVPSKIEGHKERIQETSMRKYGVSYYSQTEESKRKAKETCLRKYGVENYSQTEEARSHMSEISEQVQRKRKETLVRRYGQEYFPVENLVEKIAATNMERYGVENYSQTEEAKKILSELGKKRIEERRKQGLPTSFFSKYKYKNELFDSAWELYVYIYYSDLGYDIKREPYNIEYEYEGTTHYYYPDFEINGVLYEVKGDHFFRIVEGKEVMCNPYDSSRNGIYEAKYQCMKEQGVKVLRKKEMQFYVDKVCEKYGKKYIDQFELK